MEELARGAEVAPGTSSVSVKLPVKAAVLTVVEYKAIQGGHIFKCKCRKLELEGVPCSHVLAAKTIVSPALPSHALFDPIYSMTNYKSMFSDDIAVRVPSVKVNELTLDGFTKAPNIPVPKGRPKVQRIKLPQTCCSRACGGVSPTNIQEVRSLRQERTQQSNVRGPNPLIQPLLHPYKSQYVFK
jgi:hypothetical protein